MPFLEYVLLAILGGTPAAAPTKALTADAVAQPAGGTGEPLTQKKPTNSKVSQSDSGRKVTRTAARHHRRGHRKGKVYESGKKARNSTTS